MTDYFVPSLWPKRRLNLVCGSSGAGKTRWIIPQLFDLQKSGVKVLYTCCDRTIEDARETMAELGYDPSELDTVSFMDDSGSDWTPEGLYKLTEGIEHDILFIETIGALAGDVNKMSDVLRFGRRINTYMRLTGASVWGSSWCPKTRENDKFIRTRDNVMGSAAWPGICGTIVYIEAKERGSSEREVTIMPRSGPERVEAYRFDERGRLEKFVKPTLEGFLAEASGRITWADMESWAEEVGVGKTKLKEWKNQQIDRGKLRLYQRGIYYVCE